MVLKKLNRVIFQSFSKILYFQSLKNSFKKGYEESKRYLYPKPSLIENKLKYWTFIYENKINNILLLEDRENEEAVI